MLVDIIYVVGATAVVYGLALMRGGRAGDDVLHPPQRCNGINRDGFRCNNQRRWHPGPPYYCLAHRSQAN